MRLQPTLRLNKLVDDISLAWQGLNADICEAAPIACQRLKEAIEGELDLRLSLGLAGKTLGIASNKWLRQELDTRMGR